MLLVSLHRYGKAGAIFIATPRATGRHSLDKWIAGGTEIYNEHRIDNSDYIRFC